MRTFWVTTAILFGITTAAHAEWTTRVEPRFGGTFELPAHIFTLYPGNPSDREIRFISQDGRARLSIAAWLNTEAETPGLLKGWLLEEAFDRSVTYDPRGRNWFVLSGYQGDNIYYQKIMYTCRGGAISAFGLSYPIAQRHIYDPVVERMEDHFRPGRDCRSLR